jgi:hypothetical protein
MPKRPAHHQGPYADRSSQTAGLAPCRPSRSQLPRPPAAPARQLSHSRICVSPREDRDDSAEITHHAGRFFRSGVRPTYTLVGALATGRFDSRRIMRRNPLLWRSRALESRTDQHTDTCHSPDWHTFDRALDGARSKPS